MKKFDIEFEVHQTSLYLLTGVEAETPEEAIETAKEDDNIRSEAEEDTLLDSWDDLDTIQVVGERVEDDISSHQVPFKTPVKQDPTPFQKYKKTDGNNCPFCDSWNISAGHFTADAMIAWRYVECRECNSIWKEEFDMINIVKA